MGGQVPRRGHPEEVHLRRTRRGLHGADEGEDAEAYAKHFSHFIKEGINAGQLEGIYKKVHAAIRAKPVQPKKAKKAPSSSKKWLTPKKTYEQRKTDLKARIAALKAQ